jgi:hypothetical protein
LLAWELSQFLYPKIFQEPAPASPGFSDYSAVRPRVPLSSNDEAQAYLNQGLVLGFLYPHPEYLEPAFTFLEKAATLGVPAVVVRSYQGYLRFLQGRLPEARELFSRGRQLDPPQFAAVGRHLLGAVVRYDGTRLDLKLAGSEEKAKIYRATRSQRLPDLPLAAEWSYHWIWNADQARFEEVR